MNKQTTIHTGDIVTLRGMLNTKEKPLGIVKRKWTARLFEILWLNEDISKRFAVHTRMECKKLQVVSSAHQ